MSEPAFQGVDITYKSNADNKDIRNLLVKLVPKATAQLAEYSKQFRGKSEKETCKNIFDFLKNDIKYSADDSEQIIKLPSALLKKRIADCKSFSLFTAAVCENLKIPYQFVYASYNDNPIPSHVYVATKNGCIIDAVWGIFNSEKDSTYKYIKNMNVRYMAGVSSPQLGNCGCQQNQNGIGKLNPLRILLAPGRGVFLAILKGNFDNAAGLLTKVNEKNGAGVKKLWEKIGGKYSKLQNAIKVGASKNPKKLGLLGMIRKKVKKSGGVKGINGASNAAIQAAIVSACTAAGTAIGPPIGTAGGASLGAALAAIFPMLMDMVKLTPDAEETDVIVPAKIAPDQEDIDVPIPEATPAPPTLPSKPQSNEQPSAPSSNEQPSAPSSSQDPQPSSSTPPIVPPPPTPPNGDEKLEDKIKKYVPYAAALGVAAYLIYKK
jgi:hypothetical protein